MALPDLIKMNWFGEGRAVLTFGEESAIYNRNDKRKIECYFSTLDINEYEKWDMTDITTGNGETEEAELNGETEEAELHGETEEAELNGETEEAELNGETEEAELHGETEEAELNGETEETELHGETEEAESYVHPPPTVSDAIWQSWCADWETYKYEFINLSWVHTYREHCKPDYISWYENCIQDPYYLSVIQEGMEEGNVENMFPQEKNEPLIETEMETQDFEEIKRKRLDDLYEKHSRKRYYIHLRRYLQDYGVQASAELQEFFNKNAQINYENTNNIQSLDNLEKDASNYSSFLDSENRPNQNEDTKVDDCLIPEFQNEHIEDTSVDLCGNLDLENDEHKEESINQCVIPQLKTFHNEEVCKERKSGESTAGPVATVSIMRATFDFFVETFVSFFRVGWDIFKMPLRMFFTRFSPEDKKEVKPESYRKPKIERKVKKKFLEWIKPLTYAPAKVQNLNAGNLVLKEFHWLEDSREEKKEYLYTRDDCQDSYFTKSGTVKTDEDFEEEISENYQLAQYKAIGSNNELSEDLQKYWNQRFRLFLKYEDGIKLDVESWFSVTPEMIAVHHAHRCQSDVLVDAFCGSGGNAIQFAKKCNLVIAIDKDPEKLALAKKNASIYGVAHRIEFITGDFLELAPMLKADVVFLSPPWGGINYNKESVYDVATLGGFFSCEKIFAAAKKISNNIAIFLPKHSDTCQIIQLAGFENKVDIEYNVMTLKTKSLTAYYGDLVHY